MPFTISGSLPALFPALKIDGAGEGRHHHELGEGHAGFLGERGGGFERIGLIGGQAEDETTEHVDPMIAERLQLLDQAVTPNS